MGMSQKELIPIKEAAKRLGCSVNTVRRRIKTGAIVAYQPARAYMFDVNELALFIRESKYRPESATETTKDS
jgi:excisionase family DNA binding protein